MGSNPLSIVVFGTALTLGCAAHALPADDSGGRGGKGAIPKDFVESVPDPADATRVEVTYSEDGTRAEVVQWIDVPGGDVLHVRGALHIETVVNATSPTGEDRIVVGNWTQTSAAGPWSTTTEASTKYRTRWLMLAGDDARADTLPDSLPTVIKTDGEPTQLLFAEQERTGDRVIVVNADDPGLGLFANVPATPGSYTVAQTQPGWIENTICSRPVLWVFWVAMGILCGTGFGCVKAAVVGALGTAGRNWWACDFESDVPGIQLDQEEPEDPGASDQRLG